MVIQITEVYYFIIIIILSLGELPETIFIIHVFNRRLVHVLKNKRQWCLIAV